MGLQDEQVTKYLLKHDLPSLKYFDETPISQVLEKLKKVVIDTSTITSFNVDMSAIDKN